MHPKIEKIIAREGLVYAALAIILLLSLYLLAFDGLIWLIGLTKAQTFWDVVSSTSPKMRIGLFLFIGDLIFLYLYEERVLK